MSWKRRPRRRLPRSRDCISRDASVRRSVVILSTGWQTAGTRRELPLSLGNEPHRKHRDGARISFDPVINLDGQFKKKSRLSLEARLALLIGCYREPVVAAWYCAS